MICSALLKIWRATNPPHQNAMPLHEKRQELNLSEAGAQQSRSGTILMTLPACSHVVVVYCQMVPKVYDGTEVFPSGWPALWQRLTNQPGSSHVAGAKAACGAAGGVPVVCHDKVGKCQPAMRNQRHDRMSALPLSCLVGQYSSSIKERDHFLPSRH